MSYLALARDAAARVEAFFLRSHLWVFLGLILLFCTFLSFEFGSHSLPALIGLFLGISLLYLPTLLFVALRPTLRERAGRWPYRFLWFGAFIAYPLLVAATGLDLDNLSFLSPVVPDPGYEENTEGLQIIAVMFLAAATFLFGVLESRFVPDFRKVLWPAGAPKIIGLFLFVDAMIAVASSNGFGRAITDTDNELLVAGIFFLAVWQTLLVYLPYLGLFFWHYRFLYRKLLDRRGFVHYFLAAAGSVLVFAPVHALYARLFPITTDWEMHTSVLPGGVLAPENYGVAAGFMLFSVPVILFLEWSRKTRTITLLEKENTATELSLLKQQVNPHFFFNTLNNLYALSLRQAPETPETVLQLSELMRYVIYRAKDERVPLREEIKYLQDYLDLQRLRLYQDADIDLVVAVSDPDLMVPPLLFIILVENAFKHGVEPAAGNCFLQMELREDHGQITFTCHNSLAPNPRKRARPGGVGLHNLERRLELLYPDRYELAIRAGTEDYHVVLSLWELYPDPPEALELEELVALPLSHQR